MASVLIKQFNGKPVAKSHDSARPNTSCNNDCVHIPTSADPKCWLHGRPNAMCILFLSVIFHIVLANINIRIICDTSLLSWEWRQQFLRNVIYPQNKGGRSMVQRVNRISPRKTEFYPSAVQVGFAVDKVTLWQGFPSAASHQRSLLLRSSDVDSITHWQHR